MGDPDSKSVMDPDLVIHQHKSDIFSAMPRTWLALQAMSSKAHAPTLISMHAPYQPAPHMHLHWCQPHCMLLRIARTND